MSKQIKFDLVAYPGLYVSSNAAQGHSLDKSYPVRLFGNNPTGYPLTRDEAKYLADGIYSLLDGSAVPSKSYVAVKIVGGDEKEWHYEDPTGDLMKDDLVRVNFGGAVKIGIVRRTDTTVPEHVRLIKPVLAKFTAEEL